MQFASGRAKATMHMRYWFGIPLFCFLLAACSTGREGSSDPFEILAFTDTSSVRIDVTVRQATRLDGEPVLARIFREGKDETLWTGELGVFRLNSDGVGHVETRVSGLQPGLWSPSDPTLYRLSVAIGDPNERGLSGEVRFGFRSFETKDGKLLLNGHPIFLRGNAINPPDRTIPDSLDENRRFVESYIRYMKSVGVNIIRSTRHSQVWFDVADELGMMYFQGNYGTPQGGRSTDPPEDRAAALTWYKEEVLKPLVNHPSVVIYVLSNEQASHDIGYLNTGADEVEAFLDAMHDSLKIWDPTRVYIGNAGYGLGRSGDIADVHRYWGWYYNSFLSFYTLRDPENYWRGDSGQPITMSENTGNYTGVDGSYNLVSKSKQPDSQLNWTGHAPLAEQADLALSHQALVAKQAIEITRRIRAVNPHVAGLMPFSVPFFHWWDITRFEDMAPKPVMDQFAVSYQDVLLSWELWTPQVYAGTTIRPTVHLVNDSDSKANLKGMILQYRLENDRGETVLRGRREMRPVPYFGTESVRLAIELPSNLSTGDYMLRGEVLESDTVVSHNDIPVFVAAPGFAGSVDASDRTIRVSDPSGQVQRSLRMLRIPFTDVSGPPNLNPSADVLVTASFSAVAGLDIASKKSFVASGGRVIVLQPEVGEAPVDWLPGGVEFRTADLDHALVYPGGRPFRNALSVNPERPGHEVFDGITRARLYSWSDPTGWTQDTDGFPSVYPVTHGFRLTNLEDVGRIAILADYDHGLEGIALAELFDGKGSVLVSGFGILERTGLDPVADRLLANILRYAVSDEAHHAHPYIDEPVYWGDYGSERGLVVGVYSGLLVNTVPVVPEGLAEQYPFRIDELGFQYAGSSGGWNTRPAIQYVPQGRRAFGPYEFTLGGAVRVSDESSSQGTGRFWLRIPDDRSTMETRVENPASEDLDFELEVNGIRQTETVPAGETIVIKTSLRPSDAALAVTVRGDRRLVLLETNFVTASEAASR